MTSVGDKPTVAGIRVPSGRVVRLATEAEFGDVADIADVYGLIWSIMLKRPTVFAARCQLDLYKLACKVADEEPPAPLTPDTIAEAFIDVEEDLPEEYGDGDVPKGDGPATT